MAQIAEAVFQDSLSCHKTSSGKVSAIFFHPSRGLVSVQRSMFRSDFAQVCFKGTQLLAVLCLEQTFFSLSLSLSLSVGLRSPCLLLPSGQRSSSFHFCLSIDSARTATHLKSPRAQGAHREHTAQEAKKLSSIAPQGRSAGHTAAQAAGRETWLCVSCSGSNLAAQS